MGAPMRSPLDDPRRAPGSSRLLGALGAVAIGAIGCAGLESRTRTALEALDHGAPLGAIAAFDAQLGVARPEDAPAPRGDDALALLDRAAVLASLDRFDLSARDLGAVDRAVELLDLSPAAAEDVGRYLFSGGAGAYRAPGYEKLFINTLNLVNHLARHDLAAAGAEARRLAVVQRYLREHGEEIGAAGLGSYLAGFAFEKAGDAGSALGVYDDALRYEPYESLRDPLRALTQGRPRSRAIDALIAGRGPLPPVSETGEAEIVAVIAFGRVPQRETGRVPIGQAVSMIAGLMSPSSVAQATALAARGRVTSVSFPALRRGCGGYAIPTFFLDGKEQPIDEEADVESEVVATWRKELPAIVHAALTGTLARLAAGGALSGLTKAGLPGAAEPSLLDAPDTRGKQGAGFSLPGAATAEPGILDTPDTRSWATLPARITITRRRVPAGRHAVVLAARGWKKVTQVSLDPGGWAVVPLMALR
jgi:hypothetical protein